MIGSRRLDLILEIMGFGFLTCSMGVILTFSLGFCGALGDPLAQYWAHCGHSEDGASGVKGSEQGVAGPSLQWEWLEEAGSWALTGSRLTIEMAAALAQARMGGCGLYRPRGAERCPWVLLAEVPAERPGAGHILWEWGSRSGGPGRRCGCRMPWRVRCFV